MVRSGLDVLLADGAKRLRGARVGIVANQATIDSNLRHAVDAIHELKGHSLVRIFGPEHGFRGELQDMASVADSTDSRTGLPVVSLYGHEASTLKPRREQLTDLDILLVDLPDIGTRYYTFAQTLGYCLEAAADLPLTVLVLDRPNPLGGAEVEGSSLEAGCRSFCGYAPVAVRHGLTLGELGALMNSGFSVGAESVPALGAKLEIVRCEGWDRKHYFDEIALPWVLPSPNMPTLDTAVVYPGACLFEATELSEGRGTTRPFELVGAPGIDSRKLIAAAKAEGVGLEGAALREHNFQPQFQKHARAICSGVQVHVTDRSRFRPYRLALSLLFAFKKAHPEIFRLRSQAYEFVTNVPAIDLLYGSSRLREALENQGSARDLVPDLERFESAYLAARAPYLLY